MKKTFIVLALGALFTSCTGSQKNANVTGQGCTDVPSCILIIDSLMKEIAEFDSMHFPINRDSLTWPANLITGNSLNLTVNQWSSFVAALPVQSRPTTFAFVVSANDLLEAITDSANISNVVFYLGMVPNNPGNANTLTLSYLPARSYPSLISPNDSLVEVPFGPPASTTAPMIFDNTIPCPNCIISGAGPGGGVQLPTTFIVTRP